MGFEAMDRAGDKGSIWVLTNLIAGSLKGE